MGWPEFRESHCGECRPGEGGPELAEAPDVEIAELTAIYEGRGVPRELARRVAEALHEADPLKAHLRDELGQSEHTAARPLHCT
ncbi:VIT1/CCC1 transporter family protein [Streptomyces spiralis]